MHLQTHGRHLVRGCVLAVVGASVVSVAPAAEASPVFISAGVRSYGNMSYASECMSDYAPAPEMDVSMAENGPAVSVQHSSTATTTHTSDSGDVTTTSTALSGVGTVTSVGTTLGSIDFTAQGSSSLAMSAPTSACRTHNFSIVTTEFRFVVAQAGLLTIRFDNRGDLTTGLRLDSVTGSSDEMRFGTYGRGQRAGSTATVYLAPGEYMGGVEAQVEAEDPARNEPSGPKHTSGPGFDAQAAVTTINTSGSGSVHATFAVAGSQSAAAAGKAGRYVTFPSARACATHSLNPSVTGKRKRAKEIKEISFFVNGALVKKVKKPGKGLAVAVPVGDEVGSELRAVVKLFPARKGRPGKVLEATAGYVACS